MINKNFALTACKAVIVTGFFAAGLVGGTPQQAAAEEALTSIPYLSEISKAGFNVEVRKSQPSTGPSKTMMRPAPKTSKAASSQRAPSNIKTHKSPMRKTKNMVSPSKKGIVPQAYVIRPLPQDLKKRDISEMRNVSCVRRSAMPIDAGYIVYTKDGKELGYMADATFGPGGTFKDFRVVTFPKQFGRAECLHFTGTNPYPNERVGNNPRVAYTLSEVGMYANNFRVASR